MSKGKRYSNEGQLNYKKVFAVAIAIIVIIMFIVIIKKSLTKGKQVQEAKVVDYYALYTDNAWGVVDSTGKKVIEPMYKEMIVVVNNSKDVFLCTYDVNEQTGEYKTKVVNKENKEIYTDYGKVEAIENYDKNGNVWYENVLKVEKDGKYGLIDLDGKEVLSIQYDSIEALKGIENSLIVKKDDSYGLVNTSGVKIVDTEYKKITNFGDDYKKGYITINKDGKYGLTSYSGTQILENKYDKINKVYSENYFVIEKDGKQEVIDTNGKTILSKGYDKIKQVTSSGVVFTKGSKYGVMDYDGKVKIKAEYKDLKEINTDIFVAKTDKKYGIIDLEGKTKVAFDYNDIYYNSESGIYVAEDSNFNSSIMDKEFNTKLTGILAELNTDSGYMKIKVDDQYKYYNFKFEEKNVADIYTSNNIFVSKKDGKYGFVNKQGEVVVDYIYDDATELNTYGFAAVKKDNVWGAINSEGKVVIEPTYNLDANLVISFIGKWHLGQDINMNYYCEK
ncbi:MAG: WG repeat-containing protein [Clostridia bacterium]|nr:WG repeat-containing protein [Clostridia bacterium]